MADVTCVDGTVLSVVPVPVRDRDDVPYEATLRLLRDGRPFGEVGERCASFVTAARDRLAASDGLPASTLEHGVRAWARGAGVDPDATWQSLERTLPRDRELLALLSRDPDDLPTTGELRVRLRTDRRWADGRWERRETAVVEAWGDGGTGVRAVLDRAGLLDLLDQLSAELVLALTPDLPARS